MPSQMRLRSSTSVSFNRSSGVLDLSRITKSRVVLRGVKSRRLTWNTTLSRGFPEATSLPRSLHHMFTISTSAVAIANSAVCFSNAVSSSPRSRPSVPSRSITSVGRCFRFASVAPVESGLEARASHTPRVVCDRPRSWSISRNVVPNTWFMSVDFPELCGPITATTR